MADLTPRTRSESFLNGEDLEPITRREHFYAGRENELPEGHQEPETREEWFIKKYRGGGGGDITVESLSVTSNGTYTAPSGKAYSPVNVNVPLPQNAYLLKSIEHESIATFANGTDNFVKSLEVAIEPVQSGSGDPSPTNIRPISGWSAVDVTIQDDIDNPTTTETITIQLGDTYYGGKLDVVNGVLTITHEIKKVNTLNWYYLQNTFYSGSVGISADGSPDVNSDFVCSFAKSVNKEWNQLSNNECTLRKNLYSQGYYSLCVKNTEYSDATDFKNSLDSTSEITFPLATPLTIQLTPTMMVKSLQGDNNFFADSGEIIKLQYWGEVS